MQLTRWWRAVPFSGQVAKLTPEPDGSILGDSKSLPMLCQAFPHCLKQVPNSSWHPQKPAYYVYAVGPDGAHRRPKPLSHASLQPWASFLAHLDEVATAVKDK